MTFTVEQVQMSFFIPWLMLGLGTQPQVGTAAVWWPRSPCGQEQILFCKLFTQKDMGVKSSINVLCSDKLRQWNSQPSCWKH